MYYLCLYVSLSIPDTINSVENKRDRIRQVALDK